MGKSTIAEDRRNASAPDISPAPMPKAGRRIRDAIETIEKQWGPEPAKVLRDALRDMQQEIRSGGLAE